MIWGRVVLAGIAIVLVGWLVHGLWAEDRDHREDERVLNGFVREFVTSVCEDTGFYKRYIRASELPVLQANRKRMTTEFRVVLYEDAGLVTTWQYGVVFSNSGHSYIDVSAHGHDVDWVSMSETVIDKKHASRPVTGNAKPCAS